MAKEFAIKFYHSSIWQRARKAYINSVFSLCERCRQPGYIVHHKIELTEININDPLMTLGKGNLEYLCQACHNEAHGSGRPVRSDVMFDDEGNLIKKLST